MASHAPPAAVIFQFVSGIWAAQAIGAAARLRVPDHLAAGPRSAEEIALGVGADPSALHRLMRGLASVGVLTHVANGKFALTPVGEVLRSDVPGSLRSMVIAQTAPAHWLPWGRCEKAFRTGKPTTDEALGMSLWEHYAKNPEEGDHFAEAMSGLSAMAMQAVIPVYSFAGAQQVVDVGGSHGGFLAAVLQKVPAARGVLFDRPDIVAGADATLGPAGVSERVERVGGDFFAGVPEGGDVYLLKHILHDWSDDECVAILTNVRNAMAPGARVVVVEMVIGAEGAPSPAPLLDLNMLVLLSGKERTIAEFGALFERAGMQTSKVIPTMSPFAVIEARAA